MVNIVLFQDSAMKRIAQKTFSFLKNEEINICDNVIWLSKGYIKFSNNIITINYMHDPKYDLNAFLSHILEGEEVVLTTEKLSNQYFQHVDASTSFNSVLSM